MLVARFFDGLSGSAFLSVAGGTVGDMFNRQQLQFPMLIYTASPFIGPSLGPLIGGFINQYTTWRWTFYLLLIWAGVNLGMIALLVPETYHPVLLRDKARKLRKETGDERWKAPMEKMNKSIPKTIAYSLLRPFQLLLLEAMVSLLCLFSAILLGILYLFFGAFPLVFEGNHGFTLAQTGLTFLGIFVGMVIAAATDPLWHKNYERLIKQREDATGEVGGSEPEYRLPPSIAGAIIVPIGLFMFAWTTYSSVHWIVPIIGSSIFGAGLVTSFLSSSSHDLIEAFNASYSSASGVQHELYLHLIMSQSSILNPQPFHLESRSHISQAQLSLPLRYKPQNLMTLMHVPWHLYSSMKPLTAPPAELSSSSAASSPS